MGWDEGEGGTIFWEALRDGNVCQEGGPRTRDRGIEEVDP